jgi:hypothetical protein
MTNQMDPRAAASEGLRWLREHAPDESQVLAIADDAWFYEMLLLRHADQHPDQATGWERSLDSCLAAAGRLDLRTCLRHAPGDGDGDGDGGVAEWAEALLGVAMLAHLVELRYPDSPSARSHADILRECLSSQTGALARLAPLHAFCLAYTLTEMGLRAPGSLCPLPDEHTVAAGLTGAERTLTVAYFHTHVVLFAFGTYRRCPADISSLSRSLEFIRQQARVVERYGWADLCAEFAICLSLCGIRDACFQRLVAALLRLRSPDGCWTHPWADARQARHSTIVSVLALLEAALPAAGPSQPATIVPAHGTGHG